MPSLNIKLEEQLPDSRSGQIAYRLTIENVGKDSIRLKGITPQIPAGVTILEVRDSRISEVLRARSDTLDDLNRILFDFLMATNKPFREAAARNGQEVIKEMWSVNFMLKLYASALVSPGNLAARINAKVAHLSFKIRNLKDAETAYTIWLKDSQGFVGEASLFHAKLEQLKVLEGEIDGAAEAGETTIEPGSCQASTYVFKFNRRLLDPRKYQVAFEVEYDHAPDTAPTDGAAPPVKRILTSANALISPYAFSMNLIAMAGSLMGFAIKVTTLSKVDNATPIFDWALMVKNNFWSAPIIALIFFNVYEYTSIGKGWVMAISWRSALLIGALCGLGSEKIIDALRALVGS